ncbi:MAG: Flp pilus assembly complex ATPase component TadA [Victivallales bacterium]|nr:Flp pilus assembly complex ATPase component TadA [Victivallales bacterium]
MLDFLNYLQDQSVLLPEQLKAVRSRMQRTGLSPEQTVLELQLIPEAQLYAHLAAFHDLSLCDLNHQQPSPAALAKVPGRLATRFQCVPITLHHGTLLLAFTHVPPQTTLDQLQLLLGTRLHVALCRPSQFEQWQRQNFGIAADNVQQLRQQRRNSIQAKAPDALSVEITGDTSEASIIRVVNEILDQAIAAQATDVHLEPFRDTLRIRFRIDGMLREVPTPQGLSDLTEAIISRIKVMAQVDIAEKRLPHDGRIRLLRHGVPCNLRVSLLPTRFGETLCLRLLDTSNILLQTSELGLSQHQLEQLHRIVAQPNGLILVTGPTGSGKTTTLYSVLAHLRDQRPELKIITVEDPVEYEMPGLTQIQTHAEIGLTFAVALRSILRHDPDIILIGEIRDRETAEIAIQSALTGHLVFSTLHTNDSVGAVSRLINMGIESDLIAASLSCVIAQRLVRRLCSECSEQTTIDDLTIDDQAELTAILQRSGLPSTDLPIRKAHPGGCTQCGHTGYHGRIAIYEFLQASEELEDLICGHAPVSELRHAALRDGLRSFREDGWLKVAAGITSAEEINRVTLPPK